MLEQVRGKMWPLSFDRETGTETRAHGVDPGGPYTRDQAERLVSMASPWKPGYYFFEPLYMAVNCAVYDFAPRSAEKSESSGDARMENVPESTACSFWFLSSVSMKRNTCTWLWSWRTARVQLFKTKVSVSWLRLATYSMT